MIRFALALSVGALLVGAGVPAQAQQSAAPAASQKAAPSGTHCKKVYVQKKSARTGKYVHVPRQRCS